MGWHGGGRGGGGEEVTILLKQLGVRLWSILNAMLKNKDLSLYSEENISDQVMACWKKYWYRYGK